MARSPEGRVDRLTASLTDRPSGAAAGHAAAGPARATASAPKSTADVRDIVTEAIRRRTPLRVVGRGTWLDAGRPVVGAEPVALDQLTGIVDYTPGDLTLTARAGTSLTEIAAATAPHGQWLALAPWGGDAGSLGGTVATATAGPLSGAFGTPRDIVIGLEAVTGTGEVVRGGGRVVKNVAGFDLTRLMVGAWGTLGVLTEVSVRLRGLPENDVTVVLAARDGAAQLAELLAHLRAMPIAPLALELVTGSLANRLGLAGSAAVLVRLAGNAETVAAQRDALGQLGDMDETSSNVWDALRASDAADATVVRFSGPATRFADTWASATEVAAAGGGFAHATMFRSVARVIVPNVNHALPEPPLAAIRAARADVRIFERLPAELWSTLAPSPVTDRLSRGVRAAFDPHRLFNPGILGEDGA